MIQERNKHDQEIIDNVDKAIQELVYDKTSLIKAYNYYQGKRDPEQFNHLELNYGIGTATSVEFVPLTRKHVDVLVGEYLSTPLLPRISCKDKNTLSNIHREKQLKINNVVINELKKHIKSTIYSSISGDKQAGDKEVEKRIENLVEGTDRNFISEYEIASQNIVDWAIQSRNIDFINQRKTLLLDLFISGTCYFRTSPSSSRTNIVLETLNPIDTFIDRNPNSPYLKDSTRAVVRKYLTIDQILAKYGNILNKDDIEILESKSEYGDSNSNVSYIRSSEDFIESGESDGILGGFEVSPSSFNTNTNRNFRSYPVYEVEWLKAEKEDKKYITYRYEGVRIGSEIYICTGKSENVIRSIDNPESCCLSINGIFYSDRNGEPYSLMLKTANLQDKNDILLFYRDNLISESGSIGDWLDVSRIPSFLGSNVTERLLKWKAYKKTGLALYDSSQEGIPMVNTAFNGYDDTIKLSAIQAIDLAIQRNEETCSMITGVFRERLGGIEQKDAVTNVQTGIRQSSYVTKQYYQTMDLVTREMLLSILDLTKIVYKNGMSGTLILGDRLNKIFTALPEYYTVTDHDIHIADSSKIIQEQETIKQLTFELTKNNSIDPEILLDIVTSTGLTRMKLDVKDSLEKKRKENDQLGQLSQQVEQLNDQLKQATQQAEKLKKEVESSKNERLQLEKEKLEHVKQIEWFKAKDASNYNESKLEWEKKRVELEALELVDNDRRNDEIRNK